MSSDGDAGGDTSVRATAIARRPRPPGPARPTELLLIWLPLAAFLGGLLRHGPAFEPLVDGWLGTTTTALPSLLCLAAARRAGARRGEVLLVGAGSLMWSVGGLMTVLASARGESLPFPSLADAAFLCFVPCTFAAIALGVRRELGRLQGSVWLDSAIGGLGAAAGLSVLLGPVIGGASGGLLATGVAVAYPFSDLLLAATLVGVAALQGLRVGRHWVGLTLGLAVFAAADVVYALRVATDNYALGTPLDLLWSLGLSLLALWARRAGSASVDGPERPATRSALAVPVLASGVALTVLVAATREPMSAVVVLLATLTLIASAARAQLAFRQLVRLADLRRQARTDELTGLGNRRALYEQLTRLLGTSAVGQVAVLLVDLDHFKEINDTLGHHVGDELLRQVGPRLVPVLRPEDLLVRTGGDEFAVVVPSVDGATAEAVARRLLDELCQPFTLDGVPLRIGASIGVALWPRHAADVNGLLQRADVAMYGVKERGGGVATYDPRRDLHSRERLQTVEEVRVALDAGQLSVHYQPQCDVGTGAVVGVEALVRWQHPRRGLIYPDAFLPLVEQTGLMPALTLSVLEQALRQCRQWRLDGLDLRMSVNLSASNLLDQRLPEQVAWLLTSNDVPAAALVLELTENTLMADPEQCRTTLLRLAELGVGLSVDDYGTGYCSLAYLRNLPVDELKLDRAFLAQVQDERNGAIVRSTVELAHALGLRFVAEGVEDEDTLVLLRRFGADTAQGYHLSRPQRADVLTAWLRTRRVGAGATRLPVPFPR